MTVDSAPEPEPAVEVCLTPPASPRTATPHSHLLEAYETLKTEKESLTALVLLKTADEANVQLELDETKRLLEEKTKKMEEMDDRLKLKSVSIECQLSEAEGSAMDQMCATIKERDLWKDKASELESKLEQLQMKEQSLSQEVETLTSRDRLQTATIETSRQEIARLTKDLLSFEDRFSSLADKAVEAIVSGSGTSTGDNRQEPPGQESQGNEQDERVRTLEALVKELRSSAEDSNSALLTKLSEQKKQWDTERAALQHKIAGLVEEKESIEKEVAEIAELLEKDQKQQRYSGATEIEVNVLNPTKPSSVVE
ncbi:unnamed protein product [Pseudo-nitzschia multistriata]|uniref:Uncharacterized protein n=1 Tax=Pseudo-nitzschia multistriata TaxID=183589 RepID=A0A448YUH6_9STRA|nr:unnamed protein product [Pseudo-nitzschia multistriata]